MLLRGQYRGPILYLTACGVFTRRCLVSAKETSFLCARLCNVIKIQHLRCCRGASNLGPYCAERLGWGFYETLLGLGKGNKLPLRSTYILACRRHALSKTILIGPTPYFFLASIFLTFFVPRLGVDRSNSHSP